MEGLEEGLAEGVVEEVAEGEGVAVTGAPGAILAGVVSAPALASVVAGWLGLKSEGCRSLALVLSLGLVVFDLPLLFFLALFLLAGVGVSLQIESSEASPVPLAPAPGVVAAPLLASPGSLPVPVPLDPLDPLD